jgi:hypothetical protein
MTDTLKAWLLIVLVPLAWHLGPELLRALLDPEGAPRHLRRYRRGRFARVVADRGYRKGGLR